MTTLHHCNDIKLPGDKSTQATHSPPQVPVMEYNNNYSHVKADQMHLKSWNPMLRSSSKNCLYTKCVLLQVTFHSQCYKLWEVKSHVKFCHRWIFTWFRFSISLKLVEVDHNLNITFLIVLNWQLINKVISNNSVGIVTIKTMTWLQSQKSQWSHYT